jgi:uncharacterized protein with HEPN domain
LSRDIHIILTEMCGFVEKATLLLGNMTAEEFHADLRTNEAIYALVIKFGEAAAILMRDHPELVDQYPGFPARSASDMRNRLIHGYWNVNLNILYDVAARDLPAADMHLKQMLKDVSSPT